MRCSILWKIVCTSTLFTALKSKSISARRNSSANRGISKRSELYPAKSQCSINRQDLLSGLFKGGGISHIGIGNTVYRTCLLGYGCSGLINQRASSTVPSGWRFKTAISTIRSLEILVPVVSKSKAKGSCKGQRHNQKEVVRSSFQGNRLHFLQIDFPWLR